MRIGIPTFGCDSGQSGIGRYLQQLITQFDAQAPAASLRLIGSRRDLEVFGGNRGGTAVPEMLCKTVPNLLWHQLGLPFEALRRRLDVLFLPAANRRLPFWSPCPTVGTVHDMSALHVADKYDRFHQIYIKRVLPALIRRLTHVITVSESSRRDIVEFVGVPEGRVTVIPNGVDTDALRPLDRSETAPVLADVVPLDRPYLLFVSRIEHPGKNHVRLIEAFARLKQRERIPHRLVLAGPDKERAEEVHAAAASSGVGEDIVFTGFLADDKLPALYAAADVFVYPSLYEGFGIPLLEAMACDVPVVCADASSLPEVGGDAALYFDPRDAESLAASLERVLGHDGERRRLVEAGRARSRAFSWREAGRRTLEVLEEVAARGARRPANHRSGEALIVR